MTAGEPRTRNMGLRTRISAYSRRSHSLPTIYALGTTRSLARLYSTTRASLQRDTTMHPIESLRALADPETSYKIRCEQADVFAREFGWRPNDIYVVPNGLPATNLIVEAGLENAAMLSFLPPHQTITELNPSEHLTTLGLSYNSLVDWHIWIDRSSVHYYYNRTNDRRPAYAGDLASSDYATLKRQIFDEAIERAPSPNLPSLDTALLETIYNWRRILANKLGTALSSGAFSALFNALILARAVEDFDSRINRDTSLPLLRSVFDDDRISLAEAISSVISERTGKTVPSTLFDPDELVPFLEIERSTMRSVIADLYQRHGVPYVYDFSIITKQALSRIYERYVSVMQQDETIQYTLFPVDREEAWNKHLGGIYTPHYIAQLLCQVSAETADAAGLQGS